MDTKTLRKKILDLAIRGKLVPQDPNDEPASVLLDRIRAQKRQMVKDGKLKPKDIKKDTVIFKGEDNLHYEQFQDGTVKCIEDEIPFELPEGWQWERLSNLASFSGGKTPSTSRAEYWGGSTLWVTSKDMKSKYITSSKLQLSIFGAKQMQMYRPNTLLLVTRSGILRHTLPVSILKECATINQDLKAIILYMPQLAEYIYVCLKGMEAQLLLKYTKSGTTVENVNFDEFRKALLPIAPVQQIDRIISAIDDAGRIISNIENNKEVLASYLAKIKAKILDLAIRGKLVPQNPNDEPASVLLDRIRAEKEELIKQGKIKRDKKESVIFKGEDNSYYDDLPDSWTICSLREISNFERGITFPASAKETVATNNNIACVRTANVQEFFDTRNLIYVDKSFVKNNPSKLLQTDDIIVSTANSLELVGKSCIVDNLLKEMTFGGFVTVVRGFKVNCKYLHLCLKNKYLKGEFSFKSTQTTNIANISTNNLAETIIFLPPTNEQKRIVNAVETAFAQLDKIVSFIS